MNEGRSRAQLGGETEDFVLWRPLERRWRPPKHFQIAQRKSATACISRASVRAITANQQKGSRQCCEKEKTYLIGNWSEQQETAPRAQLALKSVAVSTRYLAKDSAEQGTSFKVSTELDGDAF